MAERKVVPRSEWAESTRKKQSDWIKENRYKPSTNIPADVGERFRAYCAAQNKTVSAVLADYIYSIVGREPDAAAPEKPDRQKNKAGSDAENPSNDAQQENDTPDAVDKNPR